jgi:NADH-quinone oxidoreductase subunit G
LTVRLDNHVAKGCVRVAAAHEDTVGLGDLMGDITVEKIDVATLTQPLATAGVAA